MPALGSPPAAGAMPMRGGATAAISEQCAPVLEQDDAVAQQAPPLLEMIGHDSRGHAVRRLRVRAPVQVLAHLSLRYLGSGATCRSPSTSSNGTYVLPTANDRAPAWLRHPGRLVHSPTC